MRGCEEMGVMSSDLNGKVRACQQRGSVLYLTRLDDEGDISH